MADIPTTPKHSVAAMPANVPNTSLEITIFPKSLLISHANVFTSRPKPCSSWHRRLSYTNIQYILSNYQKANSIFLESCQIAGKGHLFFVFCKKKINSPLFYISGLLKGVIFAIIQSALLVRRRCTRWRNVKFAAKLSAAA